MITPGNAGQFGLFARKAKKGRDFFPDVLVTEARTDVLALFERLQIQPLILAEDTTKLGPSRHGSTRRRAAISLVTTVIASSLPNFSDEKGVADALKLSGLSFQSGANNVPVLVQAYPDDLDQLHVTRRRDGFCGKISACNNLRQYGIPFWLTEQHASQWLPCDAEMTHRTQRERS